MKHILTLERRHFKDTHTVGALYVDNKEFSSVLEDPVRDYSDPNYKIKGNTAIPYGEYDIEMRISPSFSERYFNGHKLPYLLNVPDYTNVLIHQGNSSKDTEGCLLLGDCQNPSVNWISNSKSTVQKLLSWIDSLPKGDTLSIKIVKYEKK